MRYVTRVVILLLLAGAVALSACGSDSEPVSGSGDDGLAKTMPRDLVVYAEVDTDFDSAQADKVRKLAEEIEAPDPFEAIAKAWNDSEKSDFERDIKPLLGKSFAIGLPSADPKRPIGVGELADADAAKESLARLAREGGKKEGTYKGVPYYYGGGGPNGVWGVLDDRLLGALNDGDFKRLVDLQRDGGETLADNAAYKDAMAELPAERIGAAYANVPRLLELAEAQEALSQLVSPDVLTGGWAESIVGSYSGIGMALTAEDDKAVLELRPKLKDGSDPAPGITPTELMREVPDDSLYAMGYAIGEPELSAIRAAAKEPGSAADLKKVESEIGFQLERDFLSWFGDTLLFVRGKELRSIGGAVVVKATDEKAAAAALPRLIEAWNRNSDMPKLAETKVEGAEQAWSVSGVPIAVMVARAGDRVVIGAGQDSIDMALKPSGQVSRVYNEAKDLVGGLEPMGIIDIAAATQLASQAIEGAEEPAFDGAAAYLKKIRLGLMVNGADKDVIRVAISAK